MAIQMILFSFLQREEVKILYENKVRSRKGGITTENGHITTKTSFCLFSCQCRAHGIMFHMPKMLPVFNCTCFVPIKRAVSWAAEGRTAPWLHEDPQRLQLLSQHLQHGYWITQGTAFWHSLTLASSSSSISGCLCLECLCSSSWKIVLGFSSSDSLSDGGSLIQASRSKLVRIVANK